MSVMALSPQNGREHLRIIFLPLVLLVVLVASVTWILIGIRSQMTARVAASIQTVLETTDKALEDWAEQTEVDVQVLAGNDDLEKSVVDQLHVARNPKALSRSPALRNIRRLLAPALDLYRYPGFAVIAPDGVQIASQRDDTLALRDIADKNPGLLNDVMSGKAAVGLPFRSTFFKDPATHKEYPVMAIAAPVRDRNGRVVAALALRIDPRREFTETMALARLGATGETYAFDRNGRMLSESRFDEQLWQKGLIQRGEPSILNVQVRDPEPNVPRDQQPLTRMAQSAVTGHAGISLDGYRDYRGVPVTGAWLWDDHLRMGLATEMDVAEATAPYRRLAELVGFLLLSMISVATAFVLIFRHRERLLASNLAYEQALQARDDTMAIVSHDLRNPLNTVILRSHLILGKLQAPIIDRDFLKHNLEMMQRTTRHMNQLIGDLTDVAKIQAGPLTLEKQECSVTDAIEPAIERTRLLAKAQKIEFVANLPSNDRVRLSADRARITQVMDNLLGNAMKFTPAGGRIQVALVLLEHEVQISVSDTGPGIPAEALSHIFEPYWQVKKTRNGFGLGLFIAKTLVEAHRGKIWVESSVGCGTTFYFTLPVSHLPGATGPNLP